MEWINEPEIIPTDTCAMHFCWDRGSGGQEGPCVVKACVVQGCVWNF